MSGDGNRKSLGFDALINGIYFIILLLSFVMVVLIFKSERYREAYASCFVLVVPCILDEIKGFVTEKIKNLGIDIVNFVMMLLLISVAIALLVIVLTDWHNLIFGNILIYTSMLSFIKYGMDTGCSVVEIYKIRLEK